MPTVAYEVIVADATTGDAPEGVQVANAASYLAYADTTDSVGLGGNIFHVEKYDGRDEAIGLYVSFSVGGESDVERFESEMEQLAKVEAFEQVPYEPVSSTESPNL